MAAMADEYDDVDEAVNELRRQREALESDRDFFFARIAGPIDTLSEIAGEPKRDPRALVDERRRAKLAAATPPDADAAADPPPSDSAG